MSFWGKISLSVSVVSLIIIMSASFLLGAWVPFLDIVLYILFAGVLFSFILDRHFYLGFLLMRTTRRGMTMGASIAITLVFCSSLAYLSKRFEKSVDITEEKINSLSPQTLKILNGLQEDMNIIVFYKGKEGRQKKELLKKSLHLLKQKSEKVQIRYHNAYVKNKLAQEYLNPLPTGKTETVFVFVQYKGKKFLVDFPFNEEKISSAMIKATREKEQAIYFLSGHGERDTLDSGEEGLSELKSAVLQSSTQVINWSFVQDGPLPSDASALIIVGPKQAYLSKELEWIEQYLLKGGRALLALDPDRKDNLKPWLKKFGVDYKAHYITRDRMVADSLGPFFTLGIYFDTAHSITQFFGRGAFALFHLAGPLQTIQEHDAFSITDLVRTNPQTMAITNMEKKEGEISSYTLALLVEKDKKEEGEISADLEKKEPKEKDKQKDMKLAIFGDSDFLTNSLINNRGVNRDLVLNTISYLLDETDLVSIRPKRLKATQLILKTYDQIGIILLALILPILFFTMSFITWMRRRSA